MYLLNLISGVGLVPAVVYLMFFVLALTIHEWARAAMANKLGDDTPRLLGRLSLDPRSHIDPTGAILFLLIGIGWGRPVPYNPLRLKKREDELYIALVGPLSNLIVALVCNLLVLLLAQLDPTGASQPVANLIMFLQIGTSINILLAAFNLLPFPPLDGSSIIAHFVPGYRSAQAGQLGLVALLILIMFNVNGQPLLWSILNPIINFFNTITLQQLVTSFI